MNRNRDFYYMRLNSRFLLMTLILAGCSRGPLPFEVPGSHPANPDGPQSSFVPPTLQKSDEALPNPEPSKGSEGSMKGMKGMSGMNMGGHIHHGTQAEGGQ